MHKAYSILAEAVEVQKDRRRELDGVYRDKEIQQRKAKCTDYCLVNKKVIDDSDDKTTALNNYQCT
jgi:hypothetical protein